MKIKLTKPWKNHPAGTVLESVSDSILKDLKKLGVLEEDKPRRELAKERKLAKVTKEKEEKK